MSQFKVRTVRPQLWLGRYHRIPGDSSAFHLRYYSNRWWPLIHWHLNGETIECPMATTTGATALAEAVLAGKKYLNGKGGGSFLITEYGQILVPAPSPGDDRVVLVGECSGPLEFSCPEFESELFDLSDSEAFETGEAWELPYIGIQHQLSKHNELYFWHETLQGGSKWLPVGQDHDLIDKLRSLRPTGAVRFIAAYGGFVLTKVPKWKFANQIWEPRYVGNINFNQWFPKEKTI